MRRRGSLFVLIVALAMVVSGASASARSTTPTLTRATSLEASLLREINATRASNGVGPLMHSLALSRAANTHSRSMANLGFFSHASHSGAQFSERVKRYYPSSRAWTIGENLAMFGGVAPSAQSIVSAWMASPSHRANLLRPSFRDAGIAIVHHPAAPGVFGGEPTWLVTLDVGRR